MKNEKSTKKVGKAKVPIYTQNFVLLYKYLGRNSKAVRPIYLPNQAKKTVEKQAKKLNSKAIYPIYLQNRQPCHLANQKTCIHEETREGFWKIKKTQKTCLSCMRVFLVSKGSKAVFFAYLCRYIGHTALLYLSKKSWQGVARLLKLAYLCRYIGRTALLSKYFKLL